MEKEAAAIFRYLFSKEVPNKVASEYVRALEIKKIPLDERDQKLWSKISERPLLISWIDSYYALAKPQSGIRKRVQLLSAIAEASTEFADQFLPIKRSVFYLFKIGLVGMRAIVSFFLGFLYSKVLG